MEPDSNDQQQTQEDVEQTPREEETQTAVEHTESSSPLEFPAPVSADPTVPDPASLAPSPVAPASPGVDSIASSSNDFVTLPGSSLAPVGLLPAFRNIVAARSASGLFTPRTEYASGSATPEGQELEVAEEPDQKAESVLEAMLVEEEKSIQETEVVKEPEPFQKSETAQEPESVQEAKPAQETEPAQEAVSNWDGKDKVVTEETKPAEVIAVQVVDDEVVVNNAAPLATTTELAMGVVGESSCLVFICRGHQTEPHISEPSLEVPVDEPAVQGSSALDVTQETLRAATPEPKDVVEHPAPRRHGTPGTDVDADAEGDLDPDYESSREEDIIEKSSAVPNKATSIDDDDPFIVNKEDAGSPSLLVEQKAAESLPTPVDRYVSGLAPFDITNIYYSEPHADSTPHLVVSSETVDTSEAQDEPSATQETECVATDDTRPLKRKRKPSAAVLDMPVMRLTRSKTVKLSDSIVNNELELRKSRSGKGKGKQRARDDSDNDDAVSVAHSLASDATTAGSSTVADQLLIPEVGSRTSSRASSVASNAPSMYSQSSPTTVRTLATSGPNKLSPIPFMQDPNGGYRHTHRTKVPATSNVPERQPSRAPSNASEASHRSSVEPAPSQSSQPSQTQPARKPTRTAAHRTKPTPDSPVTRSHCRYHLISIPSEGAGAGRPLFFAVPGCSFSDAKLLKEEGIKDQGILVERDEVSQLILVLDDLKLPPATFAILRQLVGLDLLREHEVYYLPKPGDNVLHRSKRRRPAKPAQLESISARTSRGTNGGSASRSKDGKKAASTLTSTSFSMPPPSQASVSTSGGSGSYGRNGNPSVGGSAMGSSDLSDLDDDDVPPTKRIKESHSEAEGEDDHAEADNLNDEGEDDAHKPEDVIAPPEVPAVAQNGDGGANSEASTSTRRVPQPRRGRKLGVDAAAYKPTGGDSDGSDLEDNDDGPKKRRRGGKTRGVKRTRTDDSASTTGEVTSVSAAVERPKRRRVNAESGEAAADKPVD